MLRENSVLTDFTGISNSTVSVIIIDPDGTAGPRGRRQSNESGIDARGHLPGSHDRRVRAVENAIVAPAKRCAATKTALRSVAPLVAMVKPTHSWQYNDFGRRRWPRCDKPPVRRTLDETQVATVLVVVVAGGRFEFRHRPVIFEIPQ